jgi:hypothetical protein
VGVVVGGVGIHVKGGVDVVDICVILSRGLGLVHVLIVQVHLYHPHLAWGNVVYKKKKNIIQVHSMSFKLWYDQLCLPYIGTGVRDTQAVSQEEFGAVFCKLGRI